MYISKLVKSFYLMYTVFITTVVIGIMQFRFNLPKNYNKDMTKDMTISNQTIIIKKVYIRRNYMLVKR